MEYMILNLRKISGVDIIEFKEKFKENVFEIFGKEIDKLKVTGTKITKRTIVVPIEDTLLYVQSIYQQYTNEDNSLPLLKKSSCGFRK